MNTKQNNVRNVESIFFIQRVYVFNSFCKDIWTQNNPYSKGLLAIKFTGGVFKREF